MSFLSRFVPLVGSSNLKKIEKARIAVFGLGGVGSYTAESLVRSGIARNGTGKLILIDGDKIEKSNMNRYHKSADLKTRKIKEGKIWSSTIKNLRNRHCYCQMR